MFFFCVKLMTSYVMYVFHYILFDNFFLLKNAELNYRYQLKVRTYSA